VKVTGLPASPADVAVSVLAPMPLPRVQEPSVAMPLALVVVVPPVMDPPPEATAKVTEVPLTGLPLPSTTRTEGATATAVPTGAF